MNETTPWFTEFEDGRFEEPGFGRRGTFGAA